PTSACESTREPSPIQAPRFTYIGGMQITPGARYAPSRTADPPGTIRTPSATDKRLSGSVSLSKKGQRPWSIEASTMSPNLNPSRMPCFPHVLTRQPIGSDGAGSAARTAPAESAWRSLTHASRTASRSADWPDAVSASISSLRAVTLLGMYGFLEQVK